MHSKPMKMEQSSGPVKTEQSSFKAKTPIAVVGIGECYQKNSNEETLAVKNSRLSVTDNCTYHF